MVLDYSHFSLCLVVILPILYFTKTISIFNIIAVIFGAFASFLTLLASAFVWRIGSVFLDNIYFYVTLAIAFQEIMRALLYYIFIYGEKKVLKLESSKNIDVKGCSPMYVNIVDISIATGVGMGLSYQVLPGIHNLMKNSSHQSFLALEIIRYMKVNGFDNYLSYDTISNALLSLFHFSLLLLNITITLFMWESFQSCSKTEFHIINLFKTRVLYLSFFTHFTAVFLLEWINYIDKTGNVFFLS
uniref:Uncharacterized protein n=1 Tax=Strongyloides venezuelensis TaxID=75913 RepID=A0A0K0EYA9_STRVS